MVSPPEGPAYDGAVLAPWPNRLADATWRLEGEPQRLPVTEERTGSALHGLVWDTPWTPVELSADRVELGYDLAAREGYPFDLRLTTSYLLGDDGLLSLAQARANKTPIDWSSYAPPKPKFIGRREFRNVDLAEIAVMLRPRLFSPVAGAAQGKGHAMPRNGDAIFVFGAVLRMNAGAEFDGAGNPLGRWHRRKFVCVRTVEKIRA